MNIDEAKKRWPHADDYIQDKNKIVVRWYGTSCWVDDGDNEAADREDLRAAVRIEFMEKYPYLYPYVPLYPPHDINDVYIAHYYRGKVYDGYAVGHKPLTPERLVYLNEQGRLCVEHDWFFCQRCDIAKPRTEYGYYYFASTLCKDCCDKDPEWLRNARNETYE